MPATIMALDVATRMGVAEGEPGSAPSIYCIDFGASAIGTTEIFANAVRWASGVFGVHPPGRVVVEGLVPKYDKTIQCGLWAIIKGFAGAHRVPVDEAPIQTWRAFVLGNGRMPKREAKTRAIQVCAQLGWKVRSDDEAEAACIWIWACGQFAPKLAPRIPLFMRGAA
jgi:hypothetical protein